MKTGMFGRVAFGVALLAGAAGPVWAQGAGAEPDRRPEEAVPAVEPAQPEQAPAAQPGTPAAARTEPMVRVHRGARAATTADSRVRIGGMVISRPRNDTVGVEVEAAGSDHISASGTEFGRSIPVPMNTVGPGPTLQHLRDLEAAERRTAEAEALLAEREAAAPLYEQTPGGLIIYNPYVGRNYRGTYGRPRAPFGDADAGPSEGRVEIRRFPDLHGSAQSRFAEAARPPVEATVTGQENAQREFGRIARPPVAGPQRDRDDAQRRINRDEFANDK